MGRTKQTIEKEPEPMEKRPCWKDENRIAAAIRLADKNTAYLNSVIVPLCEHCGLAITQETRDYLNNAAVIEEAYICKVLEDAKGLADFLADSIEQEARRKYAAIRESLSGAMQRNKRKEREGYYRLGGFNEVYLDEVIPFIQLQGGYFRVDTKGIEHRYTHILSDADMAKYERQKAAAKALNDFFRGGADTVMFQAAFNISGGEVIPNTTLNYKLIR